MQEVLQQFAHVKDFVGARKSRSTRAHGTAASIISGSDSVWGFSALCRPPSLRLSAVGYMSVHQKQQQDLVNDALTSNK